MKITSLFLVTLATLLAGFAAQAQECPGGYCPGEPKEHRLGISEVTFDGGQRGFLYYGMLISEDAIKNVVAQSIRADVTKVSVTTIRNDCLVSDMICASRSYIVDFKVGANISASCSVQAVLDNSRITECSSKTMAGTKNLHGKKIETLLLTSEFLKSNPGFVETQF